MEIWKDIKGYEGCYQVSNLGNILSLYSGRKLKPYLNTWGYGMVTLSKGGIKKKQTVHRLVAVAFLSNPESKRTINHIDGNKRNNNISNLEFMTHGENIKHAYDIGIRSGVKVFGSNHGCSKLTDEDVYDIKELLKDGYRHKFIAQLHDISVNTIKAISSKRLWGHIIIS